MQLTGDCKDELLPPPPPPPPPPKFLQTKQSSKGEASFRVMYYGAAAAGAVPFTWETCPGTPKHHLLSEDNSLPPLTPPPSYLSSSSTPTRIINKNNKSTKSKILDFDFFRKSKSTSEKPLFSSSPSSTSITSRSGNNLYASRSGNNRWSRAIVHYSFNDDEDEKTPAKAPALCFGGSGSRNGAGGGHSGMLRRVRNVKKKILLIVGGSGTL